MNKQELLAKIEDEHTHFTSLIGDLSTEQLTAPGASGVWSVKDVLAHLAMWTARCVTIVFDAEQGQRPVDIDAVLDDWDALNAEDYESQKERPLDRILADFHGTHRQLLRRLQAWKETDLFDATRFNWLRGMSLGEFLAGEVGGHDADHRQQIEQWLGPR